MLLEGETWSIKLVYLSYGQSTAVNFHVFTLPYRSSPTSGITACKTLFSGESKCPKMIKRCWYCQDCCQCCFKSASGDAVYCSDYTYNVVYCSEACYKSFSMARERGMIMVNIPQEGRNKRKNVILQVAVIERMSDFNPHHIKICDILLCIGKYDTPYILFHQWDPNEQHFADFFISESYEPLEPVWKFKFSSLFKECMNKLKESGYIEKIMTIAIALCTGKQELSLGNFLMGSNISNQRLQLQPVSDLPHLGIKFPIEEKICLPKGFKARRPDSGEKCLILPEDHQLLFHNYARYKEGAQVILTFLTTDTNEQLYFIVLEHKPLQYYFCASCYYVTHDNELETLTVARPYIGKHKGEQNQTAIHSAQSKLKKVFPEIIRECGWPSLHALLTRAKLLR